MSKKEPEFQYTYDPAVGKVFHEMSEAFKERTRPSKPCWACKRRVFFSRRFKYGWGPWLCLSCRPQHKEVKGERYCIDDSPW